MVISYSDYQLVYGWIFRQEIGVKLLPHYVNSNGYSHTLLQIVLSYNTNSFLYSQIAT